MRLEKEVFNNTYDSVYRPTHKDDATHIRFRNTAWQVYQNAYDNSNNFCLMGRLSDRNRILGSELIRGKNGKMFLMDDKRAANFEITNTEQPGNVFKIDDKLWDISVNDAWLLGGIHSKSTFYLFASLEYKKDKTVKAYLEQIFIAKHPYYMTITAREVLGLMRAQYSANLVAGALYFSPPHEDTFSIGFKDYADMLGNKSKGKAIEAIDIFLKQARS